MIMHRVCRLQLHPPTGWRKLWGLFLGSILPKNDPDFFIQRESVAYWWLELDEAGVVKREIGFASEGSPLRFAPVGENWGVFVGEDVHPADLAEEVSEASFEEAWRRALETLPVKSGGR